MIKLLKIQILALFLAICEIHSKRVELQRNESINPKASYFDDQVINLARISDENSFDVIRQEINNIANLQYVTEMYLGSDPEPYRFILDTGSVIFWVPGVGCGQYPNYCHSRRMYDYKNSTTATVNYDENILIEYGKGKCSGNPGTEVVKLQQEGDPIEIDLVFTFKDEDMEGMQSNGIIGLSNSKKEKNYLDKAKEQGVISSNLFAFELKLSPEVSYFYYDDIPAYYFKDLVFVDTVTTSRWVIDLIGTYLDDFDITDRSFSYALVDTGTSYIHIHSEMFNYIVNNYALKVCSLMNREYVCTCEKDVLNQSLPSLKFFIKGGVLEIKPEDYVIKQGILCYLGLDPVRGFDFVVLGDIFLRGHFTAFDKENNRIGFNQINDRLSTFDLTTAIVVLATFTLTMLLSLSFVMCVEEYTKKELNNGILGESLIQKGQEQVQDLEQENNEGQNCNSFGIERKESTFSEAL